MAASSNSFVPSGQFLTVTTPQAPTFNQPASISPTSPSSPLRIKIRLPPKKVATPKVTPAKPKWSPESAAAARLSANPSLVLQNARHMLQHIRSAESAVPPSAEPQNCGQGMPSVNYTSASRYLHHKQALFPETPMLHHKSTKPRKVKQPIAGGGGENGSEGTTAVDMDVDAGTDTTSEPPNTDTELGRRGPGGLREQHARKRARLAEHAAAALVTREEAHRWAVTVGRLVKGKERFTVELIGEVNAALDEMEARKGDVPPEILRDGLLNIVRLLSEIQDNVYSLDGLRERARTLALVWSWMATQRQQQQQQT